MINFVSTRDYLIPPICICIPERVWEGCTSANFSHYILRTETKTSSAKDQRIYYIITKYFHAPWNYQMTLLVSFWFLFSFGTHLWPVLTKNARKAFVHMTRINCLVTTLFEVFNRLEAFLFYPFLGNQRGTQKKTHFALFGSRSEHRFSCSLAGPTTT